jgi:hypothetical protein
MPMPALVSSMPMPSYGDNIHQHGLKLYEMFSFVFIRDWRKKI